MGLLKQAVDESFEMLGEARLASWAIKDSECCANCKNAQKSRDSYNNKCLSCGVTSQIVRYNNHCHHYKKPFLGQTGDKRRDLILRDMMYRKYHC